MSHRLAVALSIAITVVLAAGIVAARDRLFVAESAAGQSVATAAAVVDPGAGSSKPAATGSAAASRIIEIALPSGAGGASLNAAGDPDRARGDDDGEREREGYREEEDDD